MFALLIAALLNLSNGSGVSSVASGDLTNGCKSSGVVRLCRHGESADLIVMGRRTKLLEGYFVDDDTSYAIRRRQNVYRVSLGKPGVSTEPMHLSYSIEFTRTSKGFLVLRLVDTAEVSCKGTRIPYAISTDLAKRTITYSVSLDDAPKGKTRRFGFPLRVGNVKPSAVSFDGHLSLIGRTGKPRDRELCAAAGLN